METTDFKLGGGGLFSRVLPTRIASSVSVRLVSMLIAWVPLLVLSVIAGTAVGSKVSVSFLGDPDPYARFLISLPLFILADAIINGRLSAVISYIWNAGILLDGDRPKFQAALDGVERRRNSIVADVIFLVLAYAGAWMISGVELNDGFSTWFAYDRGAGQQMAPAGWWYTFVSLPLYQFLLLRWIWRVFIWWHFLWQMSRLELDLTPSHPDRAGGLGILEMGQLSFLVLIVAMSAVLAAELADANTTEQVTLISLMPTVIVFTVGCLLVTAGPLLVFTRHLVRAKRRGLIEYGDLADDLFGAFGQKWIGKSDPEQKKLLGEPDPSSLADYGYVYEVVASMRVVLLSLTSLGSIVAAVLLPLSPLLLINHSWKEIVQQVFSILG